MHGLSLSIPSPSADYGEESTRTRTQARYLTRSIRVCIALNRSVLLKHCIASYCLLHTATRSPLSRLLTSLSISHVCTVERLPIVTRTCMGIGQAPSDLVSFLPSMHSPKPYRSHTTALFRARSFALFHDDWLGKSDEEHHTLWCRSL